LESLEDRSLLSFGTSGTVTTPSGPTGNAGANAGLIRPDGKIVAAGQVSISSSDTDFAVPRYNPDGSLDTSFNGTGTATVALTKYYDLLHDVALQSDNKVILGGQARRYLKGTEVHTDFALARFNANGTLDKTFNKTGKVITIFADQSNSSA